MKGIKRLILLCLMLGLTLAALTVSAAAQSTDEQSVLYNLISTDASVAQGENLISYGLNVLAEQNQMAIAGIKGNVLCFNEQRFACAMNLSEVSSITIKSLPDGRYGTLYIGSEPLKVGQTVKGESLSLVSYEETALGSGKDTSFEFTVNGEAYPIACNIYMIDEVNYCPTVSTASLASLNKKTYRDVMIEGVLSAHDPEGDALVYEITKYPSHGQVVITDRTLGTYTYVPYSDYTGEDSFCYVAYDSFGNYSSGAKVSITVSAQSTSTVYSDLMGDSVYSHAIAMTECGLMNGVLVGNHYYFEADREVTRAEFVVTAMNALGIKGVPEVQSTGFADDGDISREMKGYIALAYSKGYVSGIKSEGDIYFRPNDPITLSEASVIISNMIGYKSPSVAPTFADADKIPTFASEAIESLYTLGILEFPDKTVGASSLITRGDMASMLSLTMQVVDSMK